MNNNILEAVWYVIIKPLLLTILTILVLSPPFIITFIFNKYSSDWFPNNSGSIMIPIVFIISLFIHKKICTVFFVILESNKNKISIEEAYEKIKKEEELEALYYDEM